MACVGQGDRTIRVNASCQAGDKVAMQVAGQGSIKLAKNLDSSARWEHAQ